MTKITIKATITKITREDGKAFTKLAALIPSKAAGDVPLGEVNLTLEATQEAMFDKEKK